RSAVPEASAMGSALMAGLAAGLWSGIGEIARPPAGSTRYEPRMPKETRDALLRGWHAAVKRVLAQGGEERGAGA
ncbi:MAG TPA: glycerol kinase, partial [Spirochaetia bacterium]